MQQVPRIRNFLYGVVAVLLALLAQRFLQGSAFREAIVLYLLALGLLLYAVRRASVLSTGSLQAAEVVVTKATPGRWWGVGLLLLAGALGVFALRSFDANLELPALKAWWLYLTSIGLALVAAAALDWVSKKQFVTLNTAPFTLPLRPLPLAPSPQPGIWPYLLVIFLLAAFMRLWQFKTLPFGVWYDEAENAIQTMRYMATPDAWPIIGNSIIHPPGHYLFLIDLAFRTFGVSIYAVRVVSVAMGLLMVLAGYLVGRELFGRPVGVMLAFLLAVARWPVNVSRFGMYNVSTPLCALLTLGFLLRGLRRGRYFDFALAGFCFGIGFCIYAAFQLFVGVIFLFLLALLIFERKLVLRNWSGLLVMIVVALLVAAPLLLFAREKTDVYFARTKETSLFTEKQPGERLPALLENIRKHLLMYNYRGDPNGRHNLPDAPMLDPYTGALFVLGVGIALWRWRRPRYLLLPIWLGVMLLGGILSLDFEAPQSLRTIGAMPAVYLLSILPLRELWLLWRREGGRYYPNFVAAPLVILLLVSGYNNFSTYFYRQAVDFAVWNAYSTPETLAANLLKGLDDQTEAYLISYFHGHPTLNFLARGVRPYHRLETTDHLPLPWPADKNVALILNADSRALYDDAKRYYPNATFQEFTPPFGGPAVVYYALLTRQDIASVQGLAGSYYPNANWTGQPVQVRQDAMLNFDWQAQPPLPLPFSAEWDGVLDVTTYGAHQFILNSPGYSELYIGEQQLISGTGQLNGNLVLAEGKHSLRLRTVGAAGPFNLAWRPPDHEAEVIPPTALYVAPVTSNGLLGHYYANANWQGQATLARIDPQLAFYFHLPVLNRPYTVEWTGKIAIPQAGTYHFGLESIDESALWIDQQAVTGGRTPNVYQENTLNLEKGLHDIRVRFSDRTGHTHINLYWTPPGGNRQIIPAAVLFPPQKNYERVQLPELAALTFNPAKPKSPSNATAALPGTIQLVQQGLKQPRGLAIGPNGQIYVAETGNHRLLILSPTGELLKQVDRGQDAWVEPFDVTVDAQNRVYVADTTLGQLSILDSNGVYQHAVPAEKSILDRARGLTVDAQGRIWIANTPGGQVVALDEKGAVLMKMPVWNGDGAQPVDVTVSKDGIIFVADAGLHKLVSFAADGGRLLAWDIPVANSMDGPHLTTAADGAIYMTEPEEKRVTKLTPQGVRVGYWELTGPNGELVKPFSVAVDPAGHLWVTDVAGGNLFRIDPAQ
ncbi:MAG: PA14 domain-containing protein [Caldilineaceae bacterium]